MAETATSEAVPRQSTAWGAIRKYVNIYRVSLMERMAYRGDFLLASVLRFLPLVTTILLWRAAYDWAPEPQSGGVKRFQGFAFGEMVAYLLLVHISRMFSSMPGLAAGIARDIREGTLKKYLIQPLDLIGYLLSYRPPTRPPTSPPPLFLTRSFLPSFSACFRTSSRPTPCAWPPTSSRCCWASSSASSSRRASA